MINHCLILPKHDHFIYSDPQHDSILQRGPSILRSYSILTEDQRKDLIRRAFEVKKVLMKRLDDTEEILKDRTKELEATRTKLDRNSMMVDGEHEAMLKNRLVYFPLFPQRSYQEDSASQIHFRLAGSINIILFVIFLFTLYQVLLSYVSSYIFLQDATMPTNKIVREKLSFMNTMKKETLFTISKKRIALKRPYQIIPP